MDPIRYALQVGGPRVGPGFHPWFLFPFVGTVFSLALLAAIIYLAWKVGSYYDAAKKKL